MAANEESFPQSFYCALTLKVMHDPVIDPEGNTYERSAIEEWLRRSETSPITRSKLRIADLIPNRALRETIEAALGGATAAAASSSSSSSSSSSAAAAVATPRGSDGVELRAVARDGSLLVTVVPAAEGSRTPVDMCCVIDVSGSMSRNATLQNAAGGVEEFDIDLLDVVKHSVKTVINMLGGDDRLSIVAFANEATTHLTLTAMNEAGRRRAVAALDALQPNGATNLWAGLQAGLESLRTAAAPARSPHRLRSVLLLTDGLPNVEPPRGHVPTLERYLARHADFRCSISTFGFGYSLDSELLSQIAALGNGHYAFIPDSGFVGTIFVNYLANALSTAAAELYLSVDLPAAVALPADRPLPGGYPLKRTADGKLLIGLGSLHYHQPRHCLVDYVVADLDTVAPLATVALEYHPVTAAKPVTLTTPVQLSSSSAADADADDALLVQRARLALVDAVRAAVACNAVTRANDECTVDTSRLGDSQAIVQAYIGRWSSSASSSSSPLLAGYLKDMSGQVTQAVSRADWYSRWGQHYLPSLIDAHLSQQCNNFKDAGVQGYGKGKLFTLLQDEADDTFGKLPPPSRRIASMEVFNNVGGGCFAGQSPVLLADGSVKPAALVRKGDALATSLCPGAAPATVVCVVRTRYPHARSVLCAVDHGRLLITPWHPVSLDAGATWTFPARLADPAPVHCSDVYNFVLDAGHTVVIGGALCVTLGHHFTADVRAHPYFGSRRVVDDLARIAGWSDGIVELTPDCFQRSLVNGKLIINQIIPPQ